MLALYRGSVVQLPGLQSSPPMRLIKGRAYEARVWQSGEPLSVVAWACAGAVDDGGLNRSGVPFNPQSPLVFVCTDEDVVFFSDVQCTIYVRQFAEVT